MQIGTNNTSYDGIDSVRWWRADGSTGIRVMPGTPTSFAEQIYVSINGADDSDEYIVTWDAAGGECDTKTSRVIKGQTVPSPFASKEGFNRFLGWYSAPQTEAAQQSKSAGS